MGPIEPIGDPSYTGKDVSASIIFTGMMYSILRSYAAFAKN